MIAAAFHISITQSPPSQITKTETEPWTMRLAVPNHFTIIPHKKLHGKKNRVKTQPQRIKHRAKTARAQFNMCAEKQ